MTGNVTHISAHRVADRQRGVIPIDTIVFATDDSDNGVADARAWLQHHRLTIEDVRLFKREGQCLVVSKRELELK